MPSYSLPQLSLPHFFFCHGHQPPSSTSVYPSFSSSPVSLAWSRNCHWSTTPTIPSSWLTRAQRNNKVKSLNGNRGRRGRGIKIVAWNKGSSLLHNKHQEIESLIAGHHPHILGLSEANLRSNADLSLVQHADYELHTAPTLLNPELGISRGEEGDTVLLHLQA